MTDPAADDDDTNADADADARRDGGSEADAGAGAETGTGVGASDANANVDDGAQAGAEIDADADADESGRERDWSWERAAGVAAGVVFWGWVIARWLNDWLGGLVVARGEPFIEPDAIAAVGNGVPVIAGVFDSLGFAVEYLPELAAGLWLTVVLTAISVPLGLVLAVPLSVARVYGRFTRYLSFGYTELVRGTPLLAQLFVLYYGLDLTQYVPPSLAGVFASNAAWVAIVGFTLNGAAYQAEYIRGSIESVATGQMTAGRAIGLSRLDAIRFVVLPQALRYAIPSWSNELVYLIKYSSLAAFITVPELFNIANSIASSNFRYTAVFSLVAVLYLGIVITASKFMGRVESWTSIPGLGQGRASGER